ncbi:MAG: FHA domain-containing protein [Planctomycetes bacterium]|nr:FHA domain-containing protein [Planctomycetota bacterium]
MSTIDPSPEAEPAGAPFAPCPACGFGNAADERACLFCGEALPFQELTRRVSRRLLDAPADDAPPAAPTHGSAADRRGAPSSRLRRADDGPTAPPLALLCCRPLPPLPLGPLPLVTIGRGPECHVVLPHLEVSRHHCSIKVRRQHLVLEDEGSSNGTLVNERRVSTTDLRVGDVIKVGPYVMEVLDEERAAAWEHEDDEAPAVDVAHAMSGRIDAVPLAEVLQQLEFNARTGTLQVASGRRRGQVVLEAGRPLSAAFQGLRDDAAVLAMLALEEGRFSFARTAELGPRRMEGATLTALLLESSRRADEGRPAVSGADWDVQAEGAALAPTIGPAPRAPRLSPGATPSAPAFSAADTAVPDRDDLPAPYTGRDLAAAPAPDTVVLPPGALDDEVVDADALLERPRRAAPRDDIARARSDRLPFVAPPPPAPAPATPPARLPWAVAAALALACGALLLLRSPAAVGPDPADLAARAAALTREVDLQLASPCSLQADGPAIAYAARPPHGLARSACSPRTSPAPRRGSRSSKASSPARGRSPPRWARPWGARPARRRPPRPPSSGRPPPWASPRTPPAPSSTCRWRSRAASCARSCAPGGRARADATPWTTSAAPPPSSTTCASSPRRSGSRATTSSCGRAPSSRSAAIRRPPRCSSGSAPTTTGRRARSRWRASSRRSGAATWPSPRGSWSTLRRARRPRRARWPWLPACDASPSRCSMSSAAAISSPRPPRRG